MKRRAMRGSRLTRRGSMEHKHERRVPRPGPQPESRGGLVGQQYVESIVGELARVLPRLDRIGQRLREDASRQYAADRDACLTRLAD